MERGVIHYDHGSFFQGRQKLLYKPMLKKCAVHGTTILKWSKDLIAHLSGNNAAPLTLSATDSSEHLLAPWSITVFPVQVRIYAAFIHISNLFGRYVSDLFLIYCYFLLILLLVTGYLLSK